MCEHMCVYECCNYSTLSHTSSTPLFPPVSLPLSLSPSTIYSLSSFHPPSLRSFKLFMPLAYGMHGAKADDPSSSMYGLRWLSTWEV